MFNQLSNYFGFNRQQRIGLLCLLALSLILLIIRLTYARFLPPSEIEVRYLPLVKLETEKIEAKKLVFTKASVSADNAAFVFDPNTVTHEQLIKLGFSEKVAAIFLRFRAKGFHFRQKEDLRKVFGISDRLYSKIEKFVLIPPQSVNMNSTLAEKSHTESPLQKSALVIESVDINVVDTSALQQLPGIGPSFARRIVKYREALGGFISVGQLREVYGVTEEIMEKIKPYVRLESQQVHKLDLNQDDFKTINRHPYIGYELTREIFNWRRKTLITRENLKSVIVDETIRSRLVPYLAL